MSISSSLNAGVMGLNANSTRLSTISDNIANSETFGYKRSLVDFSSMVLEQRSSAYSAGGATLTTREGTKVTVSSTMTSGGEEQILVAESATVQTSDVLASNGKHDGLAWYWTVWAFLAANVIMFTF